MPRPFKNRKINGLFNANCYKPNGIPLSMLESIELSVDELEALRLTDLEDLYQDAAAARFVKRLLGRMLSYW
jgi:predicted DNA-binding protein (UPF0251 family)